LIFISQVKLAKVIGVELGAPGDFAEAGSKKAILRLRRKRANVRKSVHEVEKLPHEHEREIRNCWLTMTSSGGKPLCDYFPVTCCVLNDFAHA
jgi:hypothetical protein